MLDDSPFNACVFSKVGVGAACSVFAAVLANLTLAPAMILTFPVPRPAPRHPESTCRPRC